ncbi:hypothetical protein QQ045_033014 [Rhodiola kirilowii]
MRTELFCSSVDRYGQLVLIMLLAICCCLSDGYDPLDPNGNITITFDTHRWTDDGYEAMVSIRNYYQYLHMDEPGWSLGWTWADSEVIWSMTGAFATLLGNCSPEFKFRVPHSCRKDPVIRDLMPDASQHGNTVEGCCRGGVLSAFAINPARSFSSFKLMVGNLNQSATGRPPVNLTLMAPGPGYTCSQLLLVDPTVSLVINGQRQEHVFRTWKSTCTYSTFLANKIPTCCVSFSTFYSQEITSCPTCSCGCRDADQSTVTCIRQGSLSHPAKVTDRVWCTGHMCPVRVHWHIKSNYMDYWRVKLTISNYHYLKNYSNWNIVVQHPGFSQPTTTFSFDSSLLPSAGFSDVALFWGLDLYSKVLLQADDTQFGSVTTEVLMKKDLNSFTFGNGWAFPRRIYFEGENCIMPLPETFPMLPNGSFSITRSPWLLAIIFFLFTRLWLLP